MKKLLFILLLITSTLQATIYKLAESGLEDFQTTAEVDAFPFLDGDILQIKNGDSFIGGFTIEADVTIETYGTGAKPVFSAYNYITGYTQLKSNLYYKILSEDEITWVQFDGEFAQKGAYPDYSFSERFDAVTNISDTEAELVDILFASYNLVGSELIIKDSEWSFVPNKVLSQSGATLTVNPYINWYNPNLYQEFIIQNHPTFFSQNGDWAYRNDTFYVHCDDPITNHSVRYSNTDACITINAANAHITGLDIKGYKHYGVNADVTGSVYAGDMKCSDTFAGINTSATGNKTKIENSTFENITAVGTRNWGRPDTLEIINNTFNKIGLWVGQAPNILTSGGENELRAPYVALSGASEVVTISRGNRVDSIGYNGIHTNTNGNGYISSNHITETNMVLPDGGGVYVGGNSSVPYADRDTIFIFNNILENAGQGIYQDYGNSKFQVFQNLVRDGKIGYVGNDPKYSDIFDNVFYNNEENIKVLQWQDSIVDSYVIDVKIYDNVTYTMNEADHYHFTYMYGDVSVASINWSDIGFGQVGPNYIITNETADRLFHIYGGSGADPLWNVVDDFAEFQTYGYGTGSTYEVNPNIELYYNTSFTENLVISFPDILKTTAQGAKHQDSYILAPMSSVVFNSSIQSPRVKAWRLSNGKIFNLK